MTLVRRSLAFFLVAVSTAVMAQQVSPALFEGLRWRMVGPFRGGRTRAVAGVSTQSNVFYVGAVNGGVWKTTDYGRTWTPMFDHESTGSIGAIAVARSNPNVIYVASGEGLHRPDLSVGDGIYKSTDGGKSWAHLGLRDGQQIPQLAVDPGNPNRVFAAVLGHPYGPNQERGIYRSTDGGRTFQRVLFKDETTGGSDVQIDPANPEIVYAALWRAREGPWENAEWSDAGGGFFKSTDGGSTWRRLAKGLPDDFVQGDIAIAPSAPNRLYATVASKHDTGIYVSWYRSDDAGESWYQATSDHRPCTRIGGGDLPVPKVDPKNPDIVYSASIVTWKSTDAGKTWTALRGAPGGDDYQNLWINPDNPDIILLASDQGAIITVNGGQTWSSWYNQPTAQLYHANADNAFPYRLCSGQQESGSVCISSRGNDGEITMREWHPVGAEEYGYVAPDPLDPDITYGGKLARHDRRTGQTQEVAPSPLRTPRPSIGSSAQVDYRVLRTEPVVFSPLDPHLLYFASNVLWQTRDGGHSWQQISPDLTRKTWQVPASVGVYSSEATAAPTQRGVIYAVAPSPLDPKRIWAGTDDGLIHLTIDGGQHWQNVSPVQLSAWQKVSVLEASHFDPQTAYAAINTLRLDDLRPHLYRTRDGGRTWTEIVNGIPANENTNAIREDPRRKGLLFAGTERTVYVSFDDGEHWQSLRLNLPATSVRDVVVKDDDLAAATHGRGFWILDDITPLRQFDAADASAGAFLFAPQVATRVRWSMNTDTPLPPDVPMAENPLDGAVIDYWLKTAATGPVTLEISDAEGQVVRRFSSKDKLEPPDPAKLEIPAYWVRPPQPLSGAAGVHRFVWDLRYAPVPGVEPEYPIAAVPHNTAPAPTSPWALPGKYTVRLTAGSKSYTQPLTVRMDPRVKTPMAALEQQFTLSKKLYENWILASAALNQVRSARAQLQQLKAPPGALAEAIAGADASLRELEGPEGRPRPRRGTTGPDTLASVNRALQGLFAVLQDADAAPTTQTAAAVTDLLARTAPVLARWKQMKSQQIPALNEKLRGNRMPEVKIEAE